jgi:hypothetical protein
MSPNSDVSPGFEFEAQFVEWAMPHACRDVRKTITFRDIVVFFVNFLGERPVEDWAGGRGALNRIKRASYNVGQHGNPARW